MTTTKPRAMRFSVRFFIGNRTIFTLQVGEKFENEDMIVERVS